jgi:PAS domain S-box-containing protein
MSTASNSNLASEPRDPDCRVGAQSDTRTIDFLSGGGEMATLMRETDWSKTPLGPLKDWPQSLRTSVGILLSSRHPMFLAWGPELSLLYNDSYAPILGSKHPKMLGRPFTEVWSEVWEDLGPIAERALAGEPNWSENFLLFMKRHNYLEETYFTFSYSPIYDESGGIGGMFCACTDTTQAVLAERRLRTLSELSSAAAAQARTAAETEALCLAALQANRADVPFALLYRFVNGGARLSSKTGDWPESAHDLDATGWRMPAVASGSIEVIEHWPQPDDLPKSLWQDAIDTVVAVPVPPYSTTQPLAALVLGVNPRRAFDDAYRTFFERVAGAVATAMANARAFEAERRRAEALAEVDRVKTLFFSNVSHEFRTPLTLMLGPLEDALADSNLPPADRERLNVAHRNSLRLLKLVNSLLDFSRIEAERVQAIYEASDLATITTELASVFRSAVEKAGLRLHVDCPPLSEPAYIDRDMWEKIVLNLLSNAFKYTFKGEIEVRLRQTEAHFELVVRDTGTGIPAEELPKLFERFHRVAGAHGRTHEGSGIGLALVHELVKLHGGSVSAESRLEKGSTFRVMVPRGSSHLPAEQIGTARTLASTAIRATQFVDEALRWLPDAGPENDRVIEDIAIPQQAEAMSNERAYILLADDNADMRDYVRRLLAPHYEVDVVPDGEAALAAIASRRPDLLLTDVMMPRLDGIELLARLRADARTSTLPVVLLSARAGEESRVEGLQSGADDYLIKPFSARELLARVEAHVKMARFRNETTKALRESEARFRHMADHAPVMIWVTESDATCSYLSASWYRFTGQTPEVGLGFGWLDALHPDDRPAAHETFVAANAKREAFRLEYRLRRKDGEYRWAIDAAAPWFADTGKFLGYIGSVIDITERKQAEDQNFLLLREMSHRIKNLFAVANSIVALSARSAQSPKDMATAIQDRLASLTRAHELTRPGLTGIKELKNRDTTMHSLIRTIFAPYVLGRPSDSEGVVVEGPDLPVGDDAVTNVALVLHELATNAAKYGSLSSPEGTIHIDCSTHDGALSLIWKERGGPTLDRGPDTEGFGGLLTRRVVEGQFGGQLARSWEPEGLTIRLSVPLRWLGH